MIYWLIHLLLLLVSFKEATQDYLHTILVKNDTGNDQTCHIDSITPCKTIAHALRIVQNSTMISVGPGQYDINDTVVIGSVNHVALTGNVSSVICNEVSPARIKFANGTDIKISNISINGCGNNSSALEFYHCSNIVIQNVIFANSNGASLFINECGGYINLLSCSVFNSRDNSQFYISTSNSALYINDSVFKHNSAFKGGGLHVRIDNVSNVTVTINTCKFIENSGTIGGGVYVEFGPGSLQSTVTFNGCLFSGNQAVAESGSSGGGGLAVYYHLTPQFVSTDNSVTSTNTIFESNKAVTGGAIYFAIENKVLINTVLPALLIHENAFLSNSAATGSSVAVDTQQMTSEGFSLTVILKSCNFSTNTALQLDNVGTAVVFIASTNVQLSGELNMLDNSATGLVIVNSQVHVMENSSIVFYGNTGYNGGAIALYGISTAMTLENNTALRFHSNTALNQGGAIYQFEYTFPGLPVTPSTSSCFICYANEQLVSIQFHNNQASNEPNSIYTSSSRRGTNYTLFCQTDYYFLPGNCTTEIKTPPNELSTAEQSLNVYSGVSTPLYISVTDALNHNITNDTSLKAFVEEGDIYIRPESGFITDSKITVFGETNAVGTVLVYAVEQLSAQLKLTVNILQCPTGFEPSSVNGSENVCICSSKLFYTGTASCDERSLTVHLNSMNCVSNYYDELNETHLVGGACPFIFPLTAYTLSQNSSEVESSFCGSLNRRGILCGDCNEEYGLGAYAYGYQCILCNNTEYNWLLLILAQYLTITVFFVVIITFNLTIVSPAFNAFLYFSQVTSNIDAVAYTKSLFASIPIFNNSFGSTTLGLLFSAYSVWNLDFFRYFIPPLCLKENLSTVYIIFLDYIAAVYPLSLLLVTYVLIEMHDRNFRIIVCLWKPFDYCLKKCRSRLQIRTSLVDTFATFLVLSYTKLLSSSIRLLRNVFVYDIDGNLIEVGFFYNANIKMFQGVHLPFGIIAVLTVVIIVPLPPMLLMCYQFNWFQRLLEKLHLRSHGLVAFVEIYHNGFTDGRDGTKDRRYFSGIYFLLRIFLYLPATFSGVNIIMLAFPLMIYSTGLIVFIIGQPYRNKFYNNVDILIFMLLLIAIFPVVLLSTFIGFGVTGAILDAIAVATFSVNVLPFLYVATYICWLVLRKLGIFSKAKCFKSPIKNPHSSNRKKKDVASSLLFSVPDRIIRPDVYHNSINLLNSGAQNTNRYDSTGNKHEVPSHDSAIIPDVHVTEITVELSQFSNDQ